MRNLQQIYKPKTFDEAVALLKEPDTALLAGGTGLLSRRDRRVRALIDLSDLGLGTIRDAQGEIKIGAMTSLAEAADSPILRAVADGVIAQAAHRSASSLLRNQATVGGTLIVEPAGILATVLCALEATAWFTTGALGVQTTTGVRIELFLSTLDKGLTGTLVTNFDIPPGSIYRHAAIETVARTPRDKPIVIVCATRAVDTNAVTIALGGLGDFAIRSGQAERIMTGPDWNAQIDEAVHSALDLQVTQDDFRGSAEYRREMVSVLVRRALNRVAA
ncbi:MAG TPA: FAD binding domain-containing protein [Anaerolineae bacterium]